MRKQYVRMSLPGTHSRRVYLGGVSWLSKDYKAQLCLVWSWFMLQGSSWRSFADASIESFATAFYFLFAPRFQQTCTLGHLELKAAEQQEIRTGIVHSHTVEHIIFTWLFSYRVATLFLHCRQRAQRILQLLNCSKHLFLEKTVLMQGSSRPLRTTGFRFCFWMSLTWSWSGFAYCSLTRLERLTHFIIFWSCLKA